MRAALQFKNYHVLETIYKLNPFFAGESKFEDPQLFFKLDVNPDTVKQAAIILGIELGDESLETTPYYVKARILGLFDIESEGLTKKQILSLYKFNGVAILFPYLRSLVSDLSCKGSDAPIIIPTINIASMINEADEDAKAKKENETVDVSKEILEKNP